MLKDTTDNLKQLYSNKNIKKKKKEDTTETDSGKPRLWEIL